jgi:hypothetical protein
MIDRLRPTGDSSGDTPIGFNYFQITATLTKSSKSYKKTHMYAFAFPDHQPMSPHWKRILIILIDRQVEPERVAYLVGFKRQPDFR